MNMTTKKTNQTDITHHLLYCGPRITQEGKKRHLYRLINGATGTSNWQTGTTISGVLDASLSYKKKLYECMPGKVIGLNIEIVDENHRADINSAVFKGTWHDTDLVVALEAESKAALLHFDSMAQARKLAKQSELVELLQPLRDAYMNCSPRFKQAFLFSIVHEITKR
jgi:hypothetical protein